MSSYLAIVIPYYKHTFFKETLQSLANQTDQRFNVYIGNDASPEDPTDLLNEFGGKFNFIYKIFDENLGSRSLVKQWERCVEMMQDEEWLMILGDDDILDSNVVEEFYNHLSRFENRSNVIRFAIQKINHLSLPISAVQYNPILESAITSHFKKMCGDTFGSLSEHIFRKTSYLKSHFKDYELAWGSDNRAIIDFAAEKDLYSINEAVIYFRISTLNISGSGHNKTKVLSLAKQRAELFRDYKSKMSPFQRQILLNELENNVFSLDKTPWSLLFKLFYWSAFDRTFRTNLNLLKTLVRRQLQWLFRTVNASLDKMNNWGNKFFLNSPQVMRIDETTHHILEHRVSVSRFGDGELMMILGHAIGFQKADPVLQARLKEILRNGNSNHLIVTVPDIYTDEKLALRTEENQAFWRNHLSKHRKDWYRYMDRSKVYYNTAISRFYFPIKDKNRSKHYAALLKKIWEHQEILVVEGEFSRLGVGNDLFQNAVSLQRITCPAKNAFEFYAEILEETEKLGRGKLILIALGPTATVLASDLAAKGFWAIDIGHVDMEYMWMQKESSGLTPVRGRVLNEVVTEQDNSLNPEEEKKYLTSIIKHIG